MNEQITLQALPLLGALAKLSELGVMVIGVYLNDEYGHAKLHLHGEFDPNVFNATITTDHDRKGDYISHNCIFDGCEVFWLEEKKKVAA
jgi:uncharacterized protein YutD